MHTMDINLKIGGSYSAGLSFLEVSIGVRKVQQQGLHLENNSETIVKKKKSILSSLSTKLWSALNCGNLEGRSRQALRYRILNVLKLLN